jgi:hypothetical protein
MKISKHLDEQITIIDDFFYDPDTVRESILSDVEFDLVPRPYSGLNAHDQYYTGFVVDRIEWALGIKIKRVGQHGFALPRATPYEQYVRAYIHVDKPEYISVIFLNPEYPEENGTTFWRHKKTGLLKCSHEEGAEIFGDDWDKPAGGSIPSTLDESEWEKALFVEGKFNRCVIFNGQIWHSAEPKNGFGEVYDNSRLVMISAFAEDKEENNED